MEKANFHEKINVNTYILNKIKGCVFGQAIGDALGLGTEFRTREEILKLYPDGLTDYSLIYQDSHTSRWEKGDWTDDTEMWLCIANAIIENHGEVNLTAIARNFKLWHNGPHLGCGSHINNVLSMGDYIDNPLMSSELWWKLSRKNSAANGALMRTSVIGLLPDYNKQYAEDVCRLTHYDPRCVGSCVILCDLIHTLAYGGFLPSLDDLCNLADHYDERIAEYIRLAYSRDIDAVTLDDYHMGYTLYTLFAALWAYFHVESFEDGLLSIVDAGGDADTNAAVACSLLGAKFGFSSIPTKYVDGLCRKPELETIYNSLIQLPSFA